MDSPAGAYAFMYASAVPRHPPASTSQVGVKSCHSVLLREMQGACGINYIKLMENMYLPHVTNQVCTVQPSIQVCICTM